MKVEVLNDQEFKQAQAGSLGARCNQAQARESAHSPLPPRRRSAKGSFEGGLRRAYQKALREDLGLETLVKNGGLVDSPVHHPSSIRVNHDQKRLNLLFTA